VQGRVRLADPVHNVELRTDASGNPIVVLAFPYRADVVDAVRGIPGRRFDWDVKEWWAAADDATAPYVKGIVERFGELSASPDVERWLARSTPGWVGRVTAARYDGKGWFVAETIAGDFEEPLASRAVERGNRWWLPFEPEVADAFLELPGARLDARAARCATHVQVDLAPPPATLTLVAGVAEPRLGLDVNWDPSTLAAFRELPGAEGHGPTLPVDAFLIEPLERFLATHAVEVSANARPALEVIRAEHDEAVQAIRRSRARSGPSLGDVESRLGGRLQPFQRGGVAYLLEARRAFLADEQGLGKTVQALAALEADDAYPAVVVCPASLKLNWRREIEKWLPHRSVTVLSGTAHADVGADIVVLNYEVVHGHRERLALRRPGALVLDEAHFCKNPRAKRTQATRRLADAMPPRALKLALSGTPVLNRPDELISQLRIIGRLADFGSGARFSRRFRGIGAEERIHWHLRRRCFVRRLKSEVLPQLPAKRQAIVPVELDNEREYRLAERDVIAWLREQPLDLSELDAKIAATLRAERLAQLNTLKRLAARGKLEAALSWIHAFLASGERLVVFAHHQEIQEAVLERHPSAAHILGRDSVGAREAAVQAFQADDGPQLLIGSTRVASQGITLTQASNVAFLELEWTPAIHDQAEDRCHRIGQHDAVTAWYLLAADTIDETMAELIARKRGVVGAVTDGLAAEDAGVVDAVARELRAREPFRRLRRVA
jgi:superfamily II DNA or RNA helicase